MKPDYYIYGLMVITALFVGVLVLLETRARKEKIARDDVAREREALLASRRFRKPHR